MKKATALFILKRNETYSFTHYCRRSSGLWNSVQFIVEALEKKGFLAEIVEVQDNNDIDRMVTKNRPDVVIIEALWVVPEKFDVLKKLHPGVQWYCHLHSHMPFLSLEGIAMEWILGYAHRGVGLISNSKASDAALRAVLSPSQLTFLPNIYRMKKKAKHPGWKGSVMDVGCFGAIRPLKNQLLQALAAIEYAKKHKKWLRFHVNASRIETGGEPILKNLIQLFKLTPNADLVLANWMEIDEFLDYLYAMDIGLQVSLSETWNHVCCNYIDAGVPTVASKEVYWLSQLSQARDDSIQSIVRKMELALFFKRSLVGLNRLRLTYHGWRGSRAWAKFMERRSHG